MNRASTTYAQAFLEQFERQPLVVESDLAVRSVPCAGCGTRNGVKMLDVMAERPGRQVVPLCLPCSMRLATDVLRAWGMVWEYESC